MILGQSPASRVPFRPPSGFYTPRLPGASFYSHWHPFAQVMPRYRSQGQWQPPIPPVERPVPPPPMLPPPPTPAPGMSGGLGMAFGRSSPYKIMRLGIIPRIAATTASIHSGVTKAGMIVKQGTPAAYTGANVPAGTIAP